MRIVRSVGVAVDAIVRGQCAKCAERRKIIADAQARGLSWKEIIPLILHTLKEKEDD